MRPFQNNPAGITPPPTNPYNEGRTMQSEMRTEAEWRSRLCQQARCYTHCVDTAEDWVQETLLAFWHRFWMLPWEQIHDEAETHKRYRWCCQKLRWLALDARKRAYSRHEQLIVDSEGFLAIDEIEADCSEKLAIEAFIETLPSYLQRVAELYSKGYSCREIARLLGVAVGTVQGYLGRIRVLGREFLGGMATKERSASLTIIDGQMSTFQSEEAIEDGIEIK